METAFTIAPASPIRFWREWEFWILAALTAAIYFSRIADLPIRGEETRRAMVAAEILRSGDWIVPRQQGAPFLSRPPVASWPIVWFARLVGDLNLAAVRLPTVIATLLTTLLVYAYSRQFMTRLGALSSGLIYGTFAQVLQLGRCRNRGHIHAVVVRSAFDMALGIRPAMGASCHVVDCLCIAGGRDVNQKPSGAGVLCGGGRVVSVVVRRPEVPPECRPCGGCPAVYIHFLGVADSILCRARLVGRAPGMEFRCRSTICGTFSGLNRRAFAEFPLENRGVFAALVAVVAGVFMAQLSAIDRQYIAHGRVFIVRLARGLADVLAGSQRTSAISHAALSIGGAAYGVCRSSGICRDSRRK